MKRLEPIRVNRDPASMMKSPSRANLGSPPARKIDTPKKFKPVKYKLDFMNEE